MRRRRRHVAVVRRRASACRFESHAETHGHPDHQADEQTNGNTNVTPDGYAHIATHGIANDFPVPIAHAVSNANGAADGDALAKPDAESDRNANGEADPFAFANALTDSDGKTHADGRPGCDHSERHDLSRTRRQRPADSDKQDRYCIRGGLERRVQRDDDVQIRRADAGRRYLHGGARDRETTRRFVQRHHQRRTRP